MADTPLHHVEFVMGMAVSIDIRDPADRSALDDVVAWLHHVDDTFSTYKPESPISRLGLGELRLDELSTEVVGVLELCEKLTVDTGGAFDALAVRGATGGMLDPSGLVKGWSIERAAVMLAERGVRNLCINAGGDLAIRGEHCSGEPWRIGVRHPDQPMRSAAVLAVSGPLAIATSATYERGAHIIDPVTGEPAGDLASVTIVGPDLTFADAYATAVFVMGIRGLEWLMERHGDYAGFAITREDTTFSTPNFESYLLRTPALG